MDSKHFSKWIAVAFLLNVILVGCAGPARVIIEPPMKPDGFLSARWGASAEEVRKAIEQDKFIAFQDQTGGPPYALYASGTHLDTPAIFSYFFTPRTKHLYRVDVTFSDPRTYEKGREGLLRTMKTPSFSQKDVDHWSWVDKSLVILQRDATHVQISYSSGPLLETNYRERGGTIP